MSDLIKELRDLAASEEVADRAADELERLTKLNSQKNADIAALKASTEPVGKRLTNAEMGIGWDRRAGEIIWWDMPPQGSYLYTTPPTAAALVEDFKRRAVEVCAALNAGYSIPFEAVTQCAEMIESLPLIGEK